MVERGEGGGAAPRRRGGDSGDRTRRGRKGERRSSGERSQLRSTPAARRPVTRAVVVGSIPTSKRGNGAQTKDQDRGKPSQEGAKQSRKTKRPKKKVRRTRTRPRGRLARPGQDRRAHAHTHGTRAWCPLTRKGRCRRPHETAPVHRPSPLSTDGRYGKPDTSVTGSTHANHRSARSPRPTPEGPAGDKPIAGPRTGTTRSEPSVPASAGASGGHNEPGSQPASACPAQPPRKAGDDSPRGWERHHGVRRADRRTTRGHEARQRGTPPSITKAHGQLPSSNGRRVPQTRRARTTRTKPRHRNRCHATPTAVWMDECAPGGYAAPAGYEQPPSG